MISLSQTYFIYMVRCSDDTIYTGITNNLERRLRQHNGEQVGGAKYTRAKRPVVLAYVEKFETRAEAAKREYHIKHELTREQKESLIRDAH